MGEMMDSGINKIIFISKSDIKGGAAIVTFRLVQELRREGYDARMLVCEKLSDASFVYVCDKKWKMKAAFLKERLNVFLRNGFSRETLFKIDPASEGLPLWRHPLVKSAEAIVLGWVNQGMLSLKGVRRICGLGKPVAWVMHDMWNMTGICHHAGNCTGYLHKCGDCPLLGERANSTDLSHTVWENKLLTYGSTRIKFVAVSRWLAEKASESTLLKDFDVTVIPNAFDITSESDEIRTDIDEDEEAVVPTVTTGPVKIIFGGARLDDPIKNLPVLKKALKIIADRYPGIADDLRIVTFGEFKMPESEEGFAISHHHLGLLHGNREIRRAYRGCGIVVSTSDYETLPGTLIEGQAYGCIPVAMNHGGQGDIIEHKSTGWLAPWNDSEGIRAESVAEGILWAYHKVKSPQAAEMRQQMRESVYKKFSAPKVARQIIELVSG